jgi:hypothetical protein
MRQICGTVLPTKNETTTTTLHYKELFSLTLDINEMSVIRTKRIPIYFMGLNVIT